jgi:hypothetical protein
MNGEVILDVKYFVIYSFQYKRYTVFHTFMYYMFLCLNYLFLLIYGVIILNTKRQLLVYVITYLNKHCHYFYFVDIGFGSGCFVSD